MMILTGPFNLSRYGDGYNCYIPRKILCIIMYVNYVLITYMCITSTLMNPPKKCFGNSVIEIVVLVCVFCLLFETWSISVPV